MKLSRLAFAAVVLTSGLIGSARAADPAPEAGSTPQTDLIAQIALAGEMTAFGREVVGGKPRSPEALVLAGGILLRASKSVGNKTAEIDVVPTDAKGNPVKGSPEKGVSFADQAKGLFDEATLAVAELKDKARADALKAMIDREEKSEPSRGSLAGPKRITRVLNPGETHNYKFAFASGQPAAVSMTSSGPPKLQFDLAHVGGNSLLSVKGHTANYNWTPVNDKNGQRQFTVTINNPGNKPSTYTLVTN